MGTGTGPAPDRRLMADCVRAVDAVREHPAVDPGRVVVAGGSQGGGLALAVAGLAQEGVAATLVDVPLLCHFRCGAELAAAGPYPEIARCLGVHRRPDSGTRLRTGAGAPEHRRSVTGVRPTGVSRVRSGSR
ncbi:acetylxylan esterase [Streptomyces sp. CNQ085]|uniref:acetylxylan esterase n=1 Tax=Streptomyces sp. CNQ085 TaxID=2886944 RepID=UPI0035B23146